MKKSEAKSCIVQGTSKPSVNTFYRRQYLHLLGTTDIMKSQKSNRIHLYKDSQNPIFQGFGTLNYRAEGGTRILGVFVNTNKKEVCRTVIFICTQFVPLFITCFIYYLAEKCTHKSTKKRGVFDCKNRTFVLDLFMRFIRTESTHDEVEISRAIL